MSPPITKPPVEVRPAAALARLRDGGPALHVVLVIVAITISALGHVHLRLAVLQAGYDLSRETKLRHDLEDQSQKLRLELETRRNPALIEQRARGELGMAPPDPEAIRVLRMDKAAVDEKKDAPASGAPR